MILWTASIICLLIGVYMQLGEVLLFSGFFTIISLCLQGGFWYGEADDIESIVEKKEDEEIYKNQANELLGEFKTYLVDLYPDIEKTIFENMKPEKVTAYMIQYPELKSSETISKLVNLINKLKKNIYDCQLRVTSLEKNRRVRRRYQFWWCLPILPKE